MTKKNKIDENAVEKLETRGRKRRTLYEMVKDGRAPSKKILKELQEYFDLDTDKWMYIRRAALADPAKTVAYDRDQQKYAKIDKIKAQEDVGKLIEEAKISKKVIDDIFVQLIITGLDRLKVDLRKGKINVKEYVYSMNQLSILYRNLSTANKEQAQTKVINDEVVESAEEKGRSKEPIELPKIEINFSKTKGEEGNPNEPLFDQIDF